jgi:hypothetical protein
MITWIKKGFGYTIIDHVTNIPYKVKSKADRDAKLAELRAKYAKEEETGEIKQPETPENKDEKND